MNVHTQAVADLLNVSLETAVKVIYEMECTDINFSECSTRAFNKSAKAAFMAIS